MKSIEEIFKKKEEKPTILICVKRGVGITNQLPIKKKKVLY